LIAVGGAEAVWPDESEALPAIRQVSLVGGAGEEEKDLPIPSPRSQGLAADWLSFDLGALEGNIETFLEQVEQLGAELSSLLGRMNVSPLFMAVAIAAVAGEMARRQLQRPRHRPLLTACEGRTGAWFPSLIGPWSVENP
jgi:hypothetical protein